MSDLYFCSDSSCYSHFHVAPASHFTEQFCKENCYIDYNLGQNFTSSSEQLMVFSHSCPLATLITGISEHLQHIGQIVIVAYCLYI